MTTSADHEGDDGGDRGLEPGEDLGRASGSRRLARVGDGLEQLVEPAAEHGGDREQERVARGGRPVVAQSRPAVMVPPERETPGISASACARPKMTPCRQPSFSSVSGLRAEPVGDAEQDAEAR